MCCASSTYRQGAAGPVCPRLQAGGEDGLAAEPGHVAPCCWSRARGLDPGPLGRGAPAPSPGDIAACTAGCPQPPLCRRGGPLGGSTPSSPCPSLGADASRSTLCTSRAVKCQCWLSSAGLNRFSSSRTKGSQLIAVLGRRAQEEGRRQERQRLREDLWALCPRGTGHWGPLSVGEELSWAGEPGWPLPTAAGQAGSRGWGDLLARCQPPAPARCRAGGDRRHTPCQSRVPD